MTPANLLRSYQTVATQTASPGQLVVMLYDGAIRFLERALAGFEHKDPALFNSTINNNIQRAQNIIDALNDSLDLEQGGKLASTLRALYCYMDRQLTLSNVKKKPEGIRDTLDRLTTLREAWSQIQRPQELLPSMAGNSPANLSLNSPALITQ
jgi:flagellar secretion chaperone FliS